MSARRIIGTMVVLGLLLGVVRPAGAQSAPPPALAGAQETSAQSVDTTPARVSYLDGQVSFWRPGAQDWTPAALNTPLAPGDVLYAGGGANVEIQIGPSAFVRATNGTQIGLDNQEPDFMQLRVTGGQAALDLRQLATGVTVELDTPNAAFTIDRPGYYHVDVTQDSTAFATHRGGSATVTLPGASPAPIGANQQVMIAGTDSPRLAMGPAPQLSAWDSWNYQRTDYLLQAASTRFVSPAVYGTEALDRYGNWRTVETYGSVWVPSGVPADWVPYSTGRWIWDPRFGWTWLDDAPWGWAPYHYGRWVFLGSYWAWAPGPVIVQPVYAPALVVFLGGVTVTVGRPLCWAPLGWGEPVIPWWGPRGVIGVASWHGWGGPRVVNNVVINNTTNVNVTNITVYKNVNVVNGVVGVPRDSFGHGPVRPERIRQAEVQQLKPVHGPLEVKPVAASVTPGTGQAAQPPAALRTRPVVATRAPQDPAPTLRAHGLPPSAGVAPTRPARLVPSPKQASIPSPGEPRSAPGRPGTTGPGHRGPSEPTVSPAERPTSPTPGTAAPKGAPRTATPPPSGVPGPEQRRGTVERPAPPPAPGAPRTATPPPSGVPGPEQRRSTVGRPTPPPASSAPRTVTPPPPGVPGPEQRRSTVGRPTPPPPPGAPRTATPPSGVPGPEQRRSTVERPTPPPPPGAPRTALPPGARGTEQRSGPVERPGTPPQPSGPRVAPPPRPSLPSPEQGRRAPAGPPAPSPSVGSPRALSPPPSTAGPGIVTRPESRSGQAVSAPRPGPAPQVQPPPRGQSQPARPQQPPQPGGPGEKEQRPDR